MTRLAAALFAVIPGALVAQGYPSLDEAMRGATAMAAHNNGYLFIAKPDAAWVCAFNVDANHFAALVAGDEVVVEGTRPGAVCVPATHFKNLME